MSISNEIAAVTIVLGTRAAQAAKSSRAKASTRWLRTGSRSTTADT
jgi:hypothetical protein